MKLIFNTATSMMKLSIPILLITILTVTSVHAQTLWTGNNSGDWNDAGNWSAGVPGAGDDAIIPNTATDLVITADVEANDFTIQVGATVSISTNSLTVNGDFANNNGSLTVESGSSLVLLGARSGAGTETINRNLRAGQVQSMVGSPISDATVADLNAHDVFEFVTASGTFAIPAGTDALTPGKGFYANGTSPSLEGAVNAGTITIGIVTSGDRFNLIANPYAAAIDAAAFFTDNGAGIITGGLAYIWNDGGNNDDTDRNGDFLNVNSAGSAGSTNPTNIGGTGGTKGSGDWNDSFNSFQGFYVEAAADGNITFNPAQQINNDNADVNSYRIDAANTGKIRLILESEEIANDILVLLDENGTSGVDYSWDAKKRSGNSLISFYSLLNEDSYAIQTLSPYASEDISVNLGFQLAEAGSYTIKATELEGLEGVRVVLLDKLTEIEYNLKSEESITFDITESTLDNSRFSLIFTSPEQILGLGSKFSDIKVYGNSSSLKIESNLKGTHKIQIHTLDGKVEYNNSVDFKSNKATVETALQSDRVYILSIDSKTVKFIIK